MGMLYVCDRTFGMNSASCVACANYGECARRYYNNTVNNRYWLEARSQGKTLYSEISTEMSYVNRMMSIKNVIFNPPATIVFWGDGTKTVVKCQEGEAFDPEKGITMAFFKKMHGNKGSYFNEIKKWTEKYELEKIRAIMSDGPLVPKTVLADLLNGLAKDIDRMYSQKKPETSDD